MAKEGETREIYVIKNVDDWLDAQLTIAYGRQRFTDLTTKLHRILLTMPQGHQRLAKALSIPPLANNLELWIRVVERKLFYVDHHGVHVAVAFIVALDHIYGIPRDFITDIAQILAY
jgi:hypothetical protein